MTSKTDTMGDRIKASREALGMTQQQLADKVGVTRVAITNWESGEQNNLRNENLFKVADILGKSARWLALGDGPETPPETLYDAIAALPKQSPQQTLDFLAFQWNNAEGLIASDRIASYTAMIDKMRKDMEQKKNGT